MEANMNASAGRPATRYGREYKCPVCHRTFTSCHRFAGHMNVHRFDSMYRRRIISPLPSFPSLPAGENPRSTRENLRLPFPVPSNPFAQSGLARRVSSSTVITTSTVVTLDLLPQETMHRAISPPPLPLMSAEELEVARIFGVLLRSDGTVVDDVNPEVDGHGRNEDEEGVGDEEEVDEVDTELRLSLG